MSSKPESKLIPSSPGPGFAGSTGARSATRRSGGAA
jgi:hypothetical protein